MVPNFESMATADLAEFHQAAAGLAHEMLADLKAMHGEDRIRLFWPNLSTSLLPDLAVASTYGPETHDLVGGASELLMQAYLAESELATRELPN